MKGIRLLLAALLAFVCTTGTWAQVVTYSGISYDVSSGSMAFVTAISSDTDGNIAFPESIQYTNPSTGISMPYMVSGFASTATKSSLNVSKWKSLYLPYFFTQLGNGLTSELINLESVQFAQLNQLTELPSNAFKSCRKLKTVTLSNNLKTIGNDCFRYCVLLTTISSANNNANITRIGDNAFAGCPALQTVSFPGVQYIGEQAFYSCTNLQNVSIPNVTEIGASAFSGLSNLTTVDMAKVNAIRAYAFHNCNQLQQVNIEKVLEIGDGAFRSCSALQSVNLSSCMYLRYRAFYGCTSLSSVLFGPSLIEIGESAFDGCSSLTSITLPNRLNYIGSEAFSSTNIKTIDIPNGIVPVSNRFYRTASGVTVKVAAGNASFYKQLQGWNNSAFTIVEEGQKGIFFHVDPRDKRIELWVGGAKQTSISEAGDYFTRIVDMPTNLELRIPTQYLQWVLVNGSNQPSFYTVSEPTDEAYSGYKFYMFNDLTDVSRIDLVFRPLPKVNDGDVNGDGKVTIADVTKLVNVILGRE